MRGYWHFPTVATKLARRAGLRRSWLQKASMPVLHPWVLSVGGSRFPGPKPDQWGGLVFGSLEYAHGNQAARKRKYNQYLAAFAKRRIHGKNALQGGMI
jgi:hypothetical protein